MTYYSQCDRPGRIVQSVIIGAGAVYVYWHTKPVVLYGEVHIVPALAVFFAVISGLALLRDIFSLIGSRLDIISIGIPKGNKGSARWATWRDLRKDINKLGWAPYWGYYKRFWFSRKRAIFADYASNAVTFGTAGSGKGVGVVQTTTMAIRASKLLPDFKGTNACILKKPLEKRGETVRVLNLGGLHEDILGPSDFLNPLHTVTDNFYLLGGLLVVTTDAKELSLQLLPEPANAGGDNKYWHDGSRDLMVFAILQCILVHGYGATLGHVDQLLSDRNRLLHEALWAAGKLKDGIGNPLPPMPLEDSPWAK